MHESKPRVAKMPVMEVFGPTIQGEGMVIGRKTMFVRTGGCDYSCSWCDSAFTWNGTQKATMMTAQEVWEKLNEVGSIMVSTPAPEFPEGVVWNSVRNFNHVTISGGNPALIGQAMADFIGICKSFGIRVGLETQGTRWQDWFLDITDLTISPKPPSSGMVTDFDKLDFIVEKLHHEMMFGEFSLKVVIFDDKDFEYAKQVYNRYREKGWITSDEFFVSVGNEDAHEEGSIAPRLLDKLEWLWDKVIEDPECNDWRPLPQLHTLVWDNKRGV